MRIIESLFLNRLCSFRDVILSLLRRRAENEFLLIFGINNVVFSTVGNIVLVYSKPLQNWTAEKCTALYVADISSYGHGL